MTAEDYLRKIVADLVMQIAMLSAERDAIKLRLEQAELAAAADRAGKIEPFPAKAREVKAT